MNRSRTCPKISGSNGDTHDLNHVARELPRSSRVRNRVPTAFNSAACPAPSNDRQLRPTKLRVLRKRCEVIKTPLKHPAQVTTNNAPSGSAKSFVSENVLDYYQPSASHVWDCNLQKKWKRVVFGGDLRHADKGNSGIRGTDAIPDLSSEFTAGSVVWAKLSGMSLFQSLNN
ncbi:hypothetical protein EmuJ_000797300 [Echinococcus multilocularis]|uniref:Uncharacterized protein n=1 Tax=Echinococcus multilocularis TaxID=6211 RepID=A0A068YDJ2_ECHMU|nr:hypothetical protein EmuJ_000797300 [Echinococcus multilocularis]